jgi:ADP-heptose:LPS heptosyltransferase
MMPFKELERPRVLVIAMSGIGNLLMQSPLWTRLRDVNPTAEIAVLVAPRGTAEVLERNADIATIFRGNPKPSLREWIGMTRSVQRGKFDIGIVTYPGQLVTSSSLLFFGTVKMRIGHRYTFHALKSTGLFLSHALPSPSVHDVIQNLRLLEPLGVSSEPNAARYVFPLGREDHDAAEQFLAKHALEETPLLGIHPGAYKDMEYKRWPTERWIHLGRKLEERSHAKILIFGGPEERALKAAVWNGIGRNTAFEVDLPLRATAALLRHCRCFVSNDSGLMHVAVSQNVPTFGLFGPTDERRTAPFGPHGHVIRAAGTQPTYNVKELWRIRAQRAPDPSLLALSVDHVLLKTHEIVGV